MQQFKNEVQLSQQWQVKEQLERSKEHKGLANMLELRLSQNLGNARETNGGPESERGINTMLSLSLFPSSSSMEQALS